MSDKAFSEKISRIVGELHYRHFNILLFLTSFVYVMVTIEDLVAPLPEDGWILLASDFFMIALLFSTFILEKMGKINVANVYLVPIPIALVMILDVHCHVSILEDTNDLVRGLMLIVAYGVVSALPWIFWFLISIAGISYVVAAIMLLGSDSVPFLVLGATATMVSFAGFSVRYNSTVEQVRLNISNKERAEKMEQLARAKEQFVANMSHELRTPLTGLMGMMEFLTDAPLRPEDRHHLMTAKASAETLRAIIEDILDLSKLGAGKFQLKEVPFRLANLASDIAELMSIAAREKGVAMILKLPEVYMPVLLGDPGRLRQILFNLTGNAVKFTEQGAVTISINYKALPDDRAHVQLLVEDTGVGISTHDLERLFDRFEQVDNSSTREKGGAGLGLAISQELAKLMGTEIQVESELGKGSRFWVDLEFAIATQENQVLTDTHEHSDLLPATDIYGKPLKILIAEDNPVNQMLIKKLVNKGNWQSQLVSNGQEACDVAAVEKFDLILMDIQMPVMTGVEAARKIRASTGVSSKAPIIAVTANCMPEDMETYRAAGMNDVVEKPLKFDQFYSTIVRQVALTRQQNEELS